MLQLFRETGEVEIVPVRICGLTGADMRELIG
jgi:hypothetical protein